MKIENATVGTIVTDGKKLGHVKQIINEETVRVWWETSGWQFNREISQLKQVTNIEDVNAYRQRRGI